MLGIACLATLLLTWNLSYTYLWQDEANTAVLALRLLKFGKPLGYDGVNLITNDNFEAEDMSSIDQRTGAPQVAVDYYIRRGDLKADTTWKFHPIGQFLVAALGIKLLGQTTLGARLPFVVAALLSLAAFYRLVRQGSASPLMASLASLILTLNSYWLLHNRQCRYYSLSGLFLVLTLLAYLRWQRGGRAGGLVFVAACWGWFLVDYGTVWPFYGILFGAALITAFGEGRRADCLRIVGLGLGLVAALAPLVYYYELWGRQSVQIGSWAYRFWVTGFNVNQYILPLVLWLAALGLAWRRWPRLATQERQLVAISLVAVLAMMFWVPAVAPEVFVRYVIVMAPLGSFLSAWVLVRGLERRPSLILGAAALLIVTPWLCRPFHLLVAPADWNPSGLIVRQELVSLIDRVFNRRPDPNRLVIDWLAQNAKPTDEILINYEDEPLMFYLPNPIRGGVAAFRVEDDRIEPPRFAVIRRSVPFVHWDVFRRELNRYSWEPIPLKAPDVIWGNIPDPMDNKSDPYRAENLILVRRLDVARAE